MKSRLPVHAVVDSASLLLVVVIVFWKLAFTNLIIARGDVFTYFYPYLDYAAEATRQGRLPLWNPYLFMGAPFLANSQAGFFYPFNRLLAWLPVARAVNLTIILHAWIAALGVYAFGRRSLNLSRAAAVLSGSAFAVGGYLTAQVEHINQLQGLAWLPWLLVLFDAGATNALAWPTLALTVALQLLAGHTQSAFISLIGLGIYALFKSWRQLTALAGSVALGAALAAIQLIPTFELAQLSIRSGGLGWREAVSFSLKPALLGRALLPDYTRAIFPEYIAYVGVIGLALVVLGLVARWHARRIRIMAALGGLGLFFALGGYNPLYLLLVRFVPGFDLFRVPARWLVWYGLSAAALIGVGLDELTNANARLVRKTLLVWGAALSGLVALAFYAAPIIVPGADQPAGEVSAITWAGWLIAACLVIVLMWTSCRPKVNPNRIDLGLAIGNVLCSALRRPKVNLRAESASPLKRAGWAPRSLAALMLIELFCASAPLPFNRATAPQALTSLRPSILTLLAASYQPPATSNEQRAANASNQPLTRATSNQQPVPPFRFLSLSDIFFDPGDKAELESAFADQLSPDAFYDLLVATKQKEIIAPNLPLYYRLASADGFDGGILPLRDYVMFQQLVVPPERLSPDGRLREALRDVPDSKWLALMNVRYIISDKTLDGWIDNVFYDLQFSTALGPGGAPRATVARIPRFEATALGLVSYLQGATQLPHGMPVAQAIIGFDDGTAQTFTLRAGIDTAEGVYAGNIAHPPARVGGHFVRDRPDINDYVTRLRWDGARIVTSVEVQPLLASGQIVIRGAALIDERTGGFQALVISGRGRFALVHSGDVKIYENLDVLPRAFIAPAVIVAAGDAALPAMRAPAFDPTRQVVLDKSDHAAPAAGQATLVSYQPEHVIVDVEAAAAGWLVLTDAYYPGWRALVDGQPTPIVRADILFRAVAVPAGAHRVEFIYAPLSLKVGAAISALAIIITGFIGWRMIYSRQTCARKGDEL